MKMKATMNMRYIAPIALLAGCMLAPSATAAAATLLPSNATIGQNLQAPAMVELSEAAPSQGLVITLKSNNPKHLLLSTAADTPGSPSITIKVFGGFRSGPQFYLFALGKSGTVTYTASAPGFTSAEGKVVLTHSGILVAGWLNFGSPLVVTTGGMPMPIKVFAAQLDNAGKLSIVQPVRGGYSVNVQVTNSAPDIGSLERSTLTIEGGSSTAKSLFKPAKPGETTFSIDVPSGFVAPANFTTATVKVNLPGIGITDQVMIGQNLQTNGTLTLGELAPKGGLAVTLTSEDPSRLLISADATEVGAKSVTIMVPENTNRGMYYLQALGDAGKLTYTATAPGFRTRTATIALAPSGVIITGPTGPPDEAEVLRPNDPTGPNGLFASKSTGATVPLVIYTAHLDPKTHRAADITVQPLRAGMSLKVDLTNANPEIGATEHQYVTIEGSKNSAITHFKPLSLGSTVLSVIEPTGFTKPTNFTSITAIVRD